MKQIIEIEVPEGKKAVLENNQIKFVDVKQHWESIKTFNDAYFYCLHRRNKFIKYFNSYHQTKLDTYEEKVAQLRLIIAALTNNEKLSLIKDDLYIPVVQFCTRHNINYCLGDKIIGKIKTVGKEYIVVGGATYASSTAGLGYFDSCHDISVASPHFNFLQVSSVEIAEHLSIYFGRLIFDVTYGGCNCDYEWLE